MKSNTKTITRKIAVIAMLVAMNVVLSRIIPVANLQIIKISFGFVPIMISAGLLGPVGAMITCALSDFAGALLFPVGAYYFPFTLSAALNGFILGSILKKKKTLVYITFAVLISNTVCTLLLNTAFISVLYDKLFFPLLVTRFFSEVIIMSFAEILITFLLFKYTKDLKPLQKFLQ